VELRRVGLALRRGVRTAAGTHGLRPVMYVRVVTDQTEGWGECGALLGGTAADPSVDLVYESLVGGGVARLLTAAAARHGAVPEAVEVARLYNTDAVGKMSAAAIEMAVLDAELRSAGTPLATRLGAALRPVAVGAVAGIPAGHRLGALVDAVDALVDQGYARVRLKIEPGWDFWPVKSVRERHPSLALQADANGGYQMGADGEDGAERLVALDPFELACIEQPLAPSDLPGHAELAKRLETPICLDESLTSLRRLADAIRSGACAVACLKPARLGGLFAARRAEIMCVEAGVPAFVGGFFESGLARSANASLAARGGFSLAGDLSDPGGYLVCDPCGYPEVRGGSVIPSAEPGVGPHPSAAAIEDLTEGCSWFSALG
jgi:O-succinylbenzoate synthase